MTEPAYQKLEIKKIPVSPAVITVILFISSCTLQRHTIPPYNTNSEKSQELQETAKKECMLRSSKLPSSPMYTDGCSAWPDGKSRECCVKHDIVYWCGGRRMDRKKADLELKKCVSQHSGKFTASIMYMGVRMGGVPWLPFRWRWGYGYRYKEKKGYSPNSEYSE